MFGRVPEGWQRRFEALRERIRQTTPEVAVPFGRQYGVNYLATKYRVRPDKANAIYDALKELAPPVSRPTINISIDNLRRFIRENEYQTAWDRPESGKAGSWDWTFQQMYQMERRQSERALGLWGLNPIYGAMSSAEYGARSYGDAFIELKAEVIQDRALLLAGDSWRLINPKNPVYLGVEAASAIQYHPDWLPDARAAAAILWPPTICLRQGDPYAIAACILEGAGQFGRSGKGERSYTEFQFMGGLTLDDVQAFHVTTGRKAEELVRLLIRLGINLPVYIVGSREPYTPIIEGYTFKIGDRVVLATGAVGRVANVRRLTPEQVAAQMDGRQAYIELRGLKGPSPQITGWTLSEDTWNVPDIYITRVLRPREAYKMPPLTLLIEYNRKLMRERGQQRGKEFRDRYLRTLSPFNSPETFQAWFQDLLDVVPRDLGKWALQQIADREFVPFNSELARTSWYAGPAIRQWAYADSLESLGVVFGWYEMAHELGVETEPPMAGAPLPQSPTS